MRGIFKFNNLTKKLFGVFRLAPRGGTGYWLIQGLPKIKSKEGKRGVENLDHDHFGEEDALMERLAENLPEWQRQYNPIGIQGNGTQRIGMFGTLKSLIAFEIIQTGGQGSSPNDIVNNFNALRKTFMSGIEVIERSKDEL